MNWKITGGFIAAFFLIAIMALLSFDRTRDLALASTWVATSNEVMTEIEATVSDVTEAETGVRGVLLTNSDVYEESWRDGSTDAQRHLQRLHSLFLDNPNQRALLSILENATQEKLAWLARLLKTYKEHPRTGQALMMSGNDEILMDRVRNVALQMEKEEKTVLRARTDDAALKARKDTTYLRILAGTVILVLGFAFHQVRSDVRERALVQHDLAQSQEKLKEALFRESEISRVDPLTQVANRRAFYEMLDVEKRRALRYGRPLSLAYIDLDNFKAVNDSLGHAVGDALLVEVARVVRSNIRAGCCVARLGGDEFALMIPDAATADVTRFLQRLHRVLTEQMNANQWWVTFSIGAAVFDPPASSVEEMVQFADKEMYAIKSSSKNGVGVIHVGKSGMQRIE